MSQLDTKKKIRPKLGPNILMRLRFVQSPAQLQTTPGGNTGKGYELVTTNEEGDTEGAGDVELGRVNATAAASPVGTKAVPSEAAEADASAGGEAEETAPLKTPSSPTTPTGSSKKNKGTEAKFTSLVSGTKAPEDTTVAL